MPRATGASLVPYQPGTLQRVAEYPAVRAKAQTSDPFPASTPPAASAFRAFCSSVLAPTFRLLDALRTPVFHFCQFVPVCLILSTLMWSLAGLVHVCENPGLIFDFVLHAASLVPQYMNYAAPRVWTRMRYSVGQRFVHDAVNSTVPLAPGEPDPPVATAWPLAGVPLAIL